MSQSLVLGRVELGSRANGPGLRDVFWAQGCSIHCPDCINEHLLGRGGIKVEVTSLCALLDKRAPHIEGITLSGGEPTEQAAAFATLCTHAQAIGLSATMFTGRTLRACCRDPRVRPLLAHLDIVVAGPFVANSAAKRAPLLGSANQRVHFLTSRYDSTSLRGVPDTELLLGERGGTLTGVPNPRERASW